MIPINYAIFGKIGSSDGIVHSQLWNNLIAYYKLDINANETTGLSPNGVSTGIDYGYTSIGLAATFNYITDRIDIAESNNLTMSSMVGDDIPFSFSVTLKYSNLGLAAQWILSKMNNTSPNDGGWTFVWHNGVNGYVFNRYSTSEIYQAVYTTGFAPTLNTRYTICVTYDGSKNSSGVHIYINGVLQSTTNINSGIYIGMKPTNNTLRIGQVGWMLDYPYNHTGCIKEVKIWKNRILSASDVLEDYNNIVDGLSIT